MNTVAEKTTEKKKRLSGLGESAAPFFNGLALAAGSLGITVVSLALAIGTYDIEEFYGYFTHPGILLLNWVPVLLLQILLYALTNRQWAAFLSTALLILLPSGGNFYKIKFRFEPFTFADMSSVLAGLKVAGDYDLTLNSRVLAALLGMLLGTLFFALFFRRRLSGKTRLICAVLTIAASASLWFGVYSNRTLYAQNALLNNYIGDLTPQHRFINNGFVYPFLFSIADRQDVAPEDYDERETQALLATYETRDIPADRAVNLLILQLESFTDLERMGVRDIDPSLYAPLHKLQEESLSGELVANVIGGGTIHTERSFLAGSSTLLNFSRPAYSFVRYFNSQDYVTVGGHPNRPDFYNRVNVMKYLGFQEYLFNEYYGELTGGKWRCDAQFLPEVFDQFRKQTAEGKRVFSFNVTLQGHGPYSVEPGFTRMDCWTGETAEAETAEQLNAYLSMAAETQTILLEQLEQLRGDAAPTVVLLYGDHNPAFYPSSFYDEIGVDMDLTREDGFLRYYGTPYCIWANDAAKEKLPDGVFSGEGPTVSPGFLMSVLFDSLGWEGDAYMQFVREVRETLPVISTTGSYYENGAFVHALSEAGEKLLAQYRCVQYYMHMQKITDPQ